MFSTLSWVVWWMLNLAAWFSHVSLLQKRHNFTFFFFPGYHRKNILPGTKYSIQNREPDTANNLELVVQELQREFPSILTNEWEPHSFDSSVGYMWFYSATFRNLVCRLLLFHLCLLHVEQKPKYESLGHARKTKSPVATSLCRVCFAHTLWIFIVSERPGCLSVATISNSAGAWYSSSVKC